MATLVEAYSSSKSQLLAVGMAVFLGLAIIHVAGHVQADTLHEAAHDVRHATGFPCHQKQTLSAVILANQFAGNYSDRSYQVE